MKGIVYRIMLAAFLLCPFALAQPATRPAILDGVGIDQRLGDVVPMNLVFKDEAGNDIRLADCVHGRPVLLTLVYFKCPMLCTVELSQLTRSLNILSESAGEQFDIITVSFNPNETAQLAAEKKQSYLRSYRRASADGGWHFLTGSEQSISALAHAVGFNYKWDPQYQQYAHASAVMVLTPQGKISRYFLGVDYPATELRQAMNDARGETIAPPAEQVFLYCFHYDARTGRYGLIISRAMQVLGGVTFLSLVTMVTVFLVRERRHRVVIAG